MSERQLEALDELEHAIANANITTARWPVQNALESLRKTLLERPPTDPNGWSFEGLTGDGWAIIGPDDEERHGKGWAASGYGRAIVLDRADAVRIVKALNDATVKINGDRLYQAFTDVEAGYIQRPDRLSRAYWDRVRARYNYLTEHA